MQVDNPELVVERVKQGDIDESLYSRQLWVLLLPITATLFLQKY